MRANKHRHQEWLGFLTQVDREDLADVEAHLIADNYALHKHGDVHERLAKHQRFHATSKRLHGRLSLPSERTERIQMRSHVGFLPVWSPGTR